MNKQVTIRMSHLFFNSFSLQDNTMSPSKISDIVIKLHYKLMLENIAFSVMIYVIKYIKQKQLKQQNEKENSSSKKEDYQRICSIRINMSRST